MPDVGKVIDGAVKEQAVSDGPLAEGLLTDLPPGDLKPKPKDGQPPLGCSKLYSVGGTKSDFGYEVALDGKGNAYLVGTFEGTLKLGTQTLTSAGKFDPLVVKLDPAGKVLWALSGGGPSTDVGKSIALDGAGNVYVGGWFDKSMTLGTFKLTAKGHDDPFVARISPAGKVQWAESGGSSGGDGLSDLSTDSKGNTTITGIYNTTASFGMHQVTSKGKMEIYAARLDPTGKFVWAASAGGTGKDGGNAVALDSAGNAYITGFTGSTATFGTHKLVAGGSWRFFVARLSTTGKFSWVVSSGGPNMTIGTGIAVDSKGHVLVHGTFNTKATIGTTVLHSGGAQDTFVAKADGATGKWQWAVAAGGPSPDSSAGIALDAADNAYITGSFVYQMGFTKSLVFTSKGKGDVYLARLSPAGKFLGALAAGGAQQDVGTGLAVDGKGNVYLTGAFAGSASFGKLKVSSKGDSDIFLYKACKGTL